VAAHAQAEIGARAVDCGACALNRYASIVRLHRHLRFLVLAVVVLIARVTTAVLLRFMPCRRFGSITIYDLAPGGSREDTERSAVAFERLRDALALLRRVSPRTVARLANGVRYVGLNPAGTGVMFDPITLSVSLTRLSVISLSTDQVAVMLGVAATRARFGWSNYRPTRDAAAQMQRRTRREVDVLMNEIDAPYPTVEWFGQWMPVLPESPADLSDSIDAYGALNEVPPWMLRLRRYLWD